MLFVFWLYVEQLLFFSKRVSDWRWLWLLWCFIYKQTLIFVANSIVTVCFCMLKLCVKIYNFVYYDYIFRIFWSKTSFTWLTHCSIINTQEDEKMLKTTNLQQEVSIKMTKGLLDLIILQFLKNEPMHGYQVITKIRKNFGVYFGPSTIYPLLSTLEKKGYIDSEWNMNFDRPRKVYKLTSSGLDMLDFTEYSLSIICRRIAS